jgi:hypothetical protein
MHGGYSYSTEYDVERYFRDALLTIVVEGPNEIAQCDRRAAGVPRRDLNLVYSDGTRLFRARLSRARLRKPTTSSATPQRPVFKLAIPCVGPSASHTEHAG